MHRYIIAVIVFLGAITQMTAETFSENERACMEGSAEACYNAGAYYSVEGYKEKDYNSTEAGHRVAAFYKRACDLGYAKGCRAYAMNYGAGRDLDEGKGMAYYFQKACEGGDVTGCTMLKMMPSE